MIGNEEKTGDAAANQPKSDWDRIGFTIRKDVKREFYRACFERGETMTDALMRAIMAYVEEGKK